jgi:hypothetical protein
LSELLIKQYAASNRKGVVGRIGKKAPKVPSATLRIPKNINPHFFKEEKYL